MKSILGMTAKKPELPFDRKHRKPNGKPAKQALRPPVDSVHHQVRNRFMKGLVEAFRDSAKHQQSQYPGEGRRRSATMGVCF
jgi:hypothetical protein